MNTNSNKVKMRFWCLCLIFVMSSEVLGFDLNKYDEYVLKYVTDVPIIYEYSRNHRIGLDISLMLSTESERFFWNPTIMSFRHLTINDEGYFSLNILSFFFWGLLLCGIEESCGGKNRIPLVYFTPQSLTNWQVGFWLWKKYIFVSTGLRTDLYYNEGLSIRSEGVIKTSMFWRVLGILPEYIIYRSNDSWHYKFGIGFVWLWKT